jgi:hypothetical protein
MRQGNGIGLGIGELSVLVSGPCFRLRESVCLGQRLCPRTGRSSVRSIARACHSTPSTFTESRFRRRLPRRISSRDSRTFRPCRCYPCKLPLMMFDACFAIRATEGHRNAYEDKICSFIYRALRTHNLLSFIPATTIYSQYQANYP